MPSVVNLAAYRADNRASAARLPLQAPGTVLALNRPVVSPRDQELRLLSRALSALSRAKLDGNADELAEWRDELEVLALHTGQFDIRERCKLALKAS